MNFSIGMPVIVLDHDDVEHRAYIADTQNNGYIVNVYGGLQDVEMREEGIYPDFKFHRSLCDLVVL